MRVVRVVRVARVVRVVRVVRFYPNLTLKVLTLQMFFVVVPLAKSALSDAALNSASLLLFESRSLFT